MLCPGLQIRLPQACQRDDRAVGDRRSLLEAHPGRLVRHRAALPRADVLGVCPGLDAEDLVTDLELGDGGPDRLDHARQLAAKDRPLRPQEAVKMREKNGCGARQPQSDRLTVVAWMRTRISSSFGTGFSTSASRSTSGGPYRSWTTALIPPWRVDRQDDIAHLLPGLDVPGRLDDVLQRVAAVDHGKVLPRLDEALDKTDVLRLPVRQRERDPLVAHDRRPEREREIQQLVGRREDAARLQRRLQRR